MNQLHKIANASFKYNVRDLSATDRAIEASEWFLNPFTVYDISELADCSRSTAWRALHHKKCKCAWAVKFLADAMIPYRYFPPKWSVDHCYGWMIVNSHDVAHAKPILFKIARD